MDVETRRLTPAADRPAARARAGWKADRLSSTSAAATGSTDSTSSEPMHPIKPAATGRHWLCCPEPPQELR
ncbi:hypothetical protein ACLESO_58355, partial [Pyxidicoccus sp. 3LG]